MKKSFTKVIASVLCALMLLMPITAISFAADDAQTVSASPVFAIRKVSETASEFKLDIVLKSGSISCADFTVTVKDSVCTSIAPTEALALFRDVAEDASESVVFSYNDENGKSSLACSINMSAEVAIFTYTFSKSNATGVNGSDITFTVDTCYTTVDGVETDVTSSTSADNDVPATHIHTESGDWVTLTDSTCKDEGTKVIYCSECGEIAKSEVIEKKSHTPKENRVEPDCTTPGFSIFVCEVCGEEISNTVLPATGHLNTHTEHLDATCMADGYDKVICDKCGETLSTTVIPKDGSNHTNTHTDHLDATCTKEGYDKVICDDCGEILSTTVIPKLPHPETKTETLDPTCTVDGYKKVYCVKCGELISSTVIPATGHSDISIEKKNATCTENGYVKEICGKCGEVINTTILNATGHKHISEVKEASCEEDGYITISCSICTLVLSHTKIDKFGHKWSKWEVVEAATYSTPGTERRICERNFCFKEDFREIPILYTAVTGVTISNTDIKLNYKKDAQLYAGLTPADAEYSNKIEWSSSDESVATVDENGLVTAMSVGTATITASSGDYFAECTVKVEYSILQWIIIIVLFGWIWYI